MEKRNYSLRNKFTMRIGGIAEHFYTPESENELVQLLRILDSKKEKYHILSGGSNILMNDKAVYKHVIYMGKACLDKNQLTSDTFYFGASNRIQAVINFANSKGYGGFEELIGLPAMLGGIVYMNAGIGGRESVLLSISDFIVRVKVWNRQKSELEWLTKSQCAFAYRTSIFQNDLYVILGVEIMLPKQEKELSIARIQKRKEYCAKQQEWGKGCFGSCYKTFHRIPMYIATRLMPKSGGIHISKINRNWYVNNGIASFDDVIKLINFTQKIHTLFRKKCDCEIIIWD